MLPNFRIVLVEPGGPANLGSVCRAMANFGLSDLVLVAPRCSPQDPVAVDFAMHGRPVLDAARAVATIPDALAGCVLTFAATSKLGLYQRQAAVTPIDAARSGADAATGGPVAFAFGREDRGLLTSELLHFDRVVSIPAAPQYPVLNLAAAATVTCYELFQATLARTGQPALPTPPRDSPAIADRKRVMFDLLFESLERIGFFRQQQYPDHLRHALRTMLGRIELTVNEVDILIGMARQIQWYAANHAKQASPPPA